MRLLPPAFSAAAAACLLAPAAALAANGEQTPLNLDASDRAAEQVAGGGGGLVRTIVGLAVVIGVIYGLHWILKQVKSSRDARASGGGLTTLATLPLGTNRSLHLVRTGEEIVLVGAGEGGVTPIRTYSVAEARALGLLDAEQLEAAETAEPAFGRPAPDTAARAFGSGALRLTGGRRPRAGEPTQSAPARTGWARLLQALRERTVIK